MSKHEQTRNQFAESWGISVRRVIQLQEKGLPWTKKGRYIYHPQPEANLWYLQFREEDVRKREGVGDERKAKARKAEAEATLSEIEVEKARGTLVHISEFEDTLEEELQRLRAKLLNVPGTWAGQLVGTRSIAETQARLEPLVSDLVESIGSSDDDS